MLDLNTIDSATVPASPELDALIAEKWMGWRKLESLREQVFEEVGGHYHYIHRDWSPSTNPAHAGEARRKADASSLSHSGVAAKCVLIGDHAGRGDAFWECGYSETNGDKGKAEALATCRAIVAGLKAEQSCSCGQPGIPRVHHSSPCGTHCDACWSDLLADYGKQSW